MKTLVTALFSLIIISCNHDKKRLDSFKDFDFSFNDTFSDCFSIKFTSGDTVYIKQHFASAFSDSLKSGKSYYALIQASERNVLDSFLVRIDFKNMDSAYYESYADGAEFAFFLENDSINKKIYVHSYSIPIDLKEFGSWIVRLKKSKVYSPIDTIIDFKSAANFVVPQIEPPSLKFTPPKIK